MYIIIIYIIYNNIKKGPEKKEKKPLERVKPSKLGRNEK